MKSSDNFLCLPNAEVISEETKKVFSSVIVLCAGEGSRTGLGYNKMFYDGGNGNILSKTLDAVCESSADEIILVYNEKDSENIREILQNITKPCKAVTGGPTRSDSVRNGIAAVSEKSEIIAIHDGARPFVSPELIDATIFGAIFHGGAVTAVSSKDAVRIAENGQVTNSPAKNNVLIIQTPQTFKAELLKKAYDGIEGSFEDDCAVFINKGYSPVFIKGTYENRKITTPEDLFLLGTGFRIGTGFDVHAFEEGRKLILGGIEIEHNKGLKGHSDADVLVHAVMDALLSAAGKPDIGVYFPDTDEQYRDISSMILLKKVLEIVGCDYSIVNISCVVMAEKPKLAKIIPLIRKNLSLFIGISEECINISATTTEGLGIIGNEQGIAVHSIALISKKTVDKNTVKC